MEKKVNCPCLDKEKAISLMHNLLKAFGIQKESIEEALEPSFIGWFSRSIATVIFVFCRDKDGEWCVLAAERGQDAADFRGFWNCPCGYLDFDERVKECALRELYEETGVFIDEDVTEFIGYDDNVESNRQNVTFRFAAIIDDAVTNDFIFSKEHNEGNEVGEIKWIRVSDVDKYMWAFKHDKLVKEVFEKKVISQKS